jgi:hypothetical protein
MEIVDDGVAVRTEESLRRRIDRWSISKRNTNPNPNDWLREANSERSWVLRLSLPETRNAAQSFEDLLLSVMHAI